MRTPHLRPGPGHARQRGVVLFIALIVLVAMTLAGIAVMRSVGTNVLISGNMAFKQAATSVADYGVEVARTWIQTTSGPAPAGNPTLLQTDGTPGTATAGYYSTWKYDPTAPTDLAKNFDPFQYNWANAMLVVPAPDPSTQVQYVIHRMCSLPGSTDAVGQQCVTVSTSSTGGSTQNVLGGGQQPLTSTTQVYYRVTVKVTGPRNATSFIQTTLY
jgi:type IV pilus assembly protein PilX